LKKAGTGICAVRSAPYARFGNSIPPLAFVASTDPSSPTCALSQTSAVNHTGPQTFQTFSIPNLQFQALIKRSWHTSWLTFAQTARITGAKGRIGCVAGSMVGDFDRCYGTKDIYASAKTTKYLTQARHTWDIQFFEQRRNSSTYLIIASNPAPSPPTAAKEPPIEHPKVLSFTSSHSHAENIAQNKN
jgi:hypothetical protein